MTGAGHAGEAGAPAGDLYVEVAVAADERFERDGTDLISVVSIPATEAMLGTTVTVPTLDGEREIELAAGIQPGHEEVLRGAGLPRLGGRRRGNQRVIVNVVVPTNLSEEQREIAERLDETLEAGQPRPAPRRGHLQPRPPRLRLRPAADPGRAVIRLAVRCSPEQADARPRRADRAGAERGRGGARPRLRRVRDLRRRGRAAGAGRDRRRRSADGRVEVSATEIPDDWADRWRDFHKPLLVGERLWLRPSWEPPREGAIDVVVDPGQAFGTGAHPTTRLCLEFLLELEAAGEASGPLTDLGTGSGVLAIAAAKLGWDPVSRLRPRAAGHRGGSRERRRQRRLDRPASA